MQRIPTVHWNDIVYSNKTHHRVFRHVLFWLGWCVCFNLLFHFPIHVFKGWDINGPSTINLQKLGIGLFFLKTLLINSFFGVIFAQMLFVYLLTYWLIPGIISKSRGAWQSITLVILFLLTYALVAIAFKFSPSIYNQMTGSLDRLPSFFSAWRPTIIDQVTSLPFVTGLFALLYFSRRWWIKQLQYEKLLRETTEAELQLLKAQIHPHFLFNTLNNIYYYLMNSRMQAPLMLKRLSGILKYIVDECNQPLVPLDLEISMIQDYIALERMRYGNQLELTMEFPKDCNGKMIAPLLLIPFIENGFKHGASQMLAAPVMHFKLALDGPTLRFSMFNNRPAPVADRQSRGNIGLTNVKTRLALLYPRAHEVQIDASHEGFSVAMTINLNGFTDWQKQTGYLQDNWHYELV